MMTARELIEDFQRMLTEKWGYIPGAAGGTWTEKSQDAAVEETVKKYGRQWIGRRVADCSGAFVWAFKQHGASIYHGSNRIAREHVVELTPIAQAQPGMAAFKAREPGEKYYALPAEYRKGGKRYNGDLRDYYHIGLVDDNPAYVINAQSTQTGVVRSKLTNGWDCVAWPKAVQHDEGSKDTMQRQVIGGKLNLREKPDTHSNRIAQIPDGAIVTVDEYGDKWCRVEYNGKQGYAVTQFLAPVDEAPAPTVDDDVAKWVYEALEANEKERYALTMLQQLLTGAVG